MFATPSHCTTVNTSVEYMNHERYFVHETIPGKVLEHSNHQLFPRHRGSLHSPELHEEAGRDHEDVVEGHQARHGARRGLEGAGEEDTCGKNAHRR